LNEYQACRRDLQLFLLCILRATARSVKRVLAVVMLSVRPSVRLSVCLSVTTGYDSSPGEIETPGFYRMIAYSL